MARRAGPKHSTSVEETYARGRMGALAALATLALVGTGAAGAFAATTIPQSDATSEDATPAVAMVADGADTPAVITEEPADEVPAEGTTPVTPADPAPAPAPVPEVTTPTDTTAPTPTETSKPAGEGSTTTDQPQTDTTTADEAEAQSLEAKVMPLAAGPDGGTAPYVYWAVKDTDGNLVPGATFHFEYRSGRSWLTGTNADAINDCDGTCATNTGGNSLDRDTDGGEWLLEHRGTSRYSGNRIVSGDNYRVSQVTAPAGYKWVTAGANTKTIGGANDNSATWTGNTHNFGTFVVQKIPTAPVCTAGYIYSMQESGQMKQVSPGGAVTNLGTAASGVSNFNGLGIGSGGQPVYAIERSSGSGTSQNATVWVYDTTTGTWQSTGYSTSALGGNTGTNMIGGAVDLSTGLYYFGGFTSNGNFKVYEYNPSANPRIKLKATVTTTATSNANGDIAFDRAGNFYIVRGDGNNSVVYSVPQATFQGASGGTITSAATQSFSTASDVNGVAFDSTGKAFLGSSSSVRSYNLPNWTGSTSVTTGLSNSTDLASCSSPPTIVIEKEIIGGRVNTGDQFKLTLHQVNTLIGDATTSGNTTGLQGQRVGPTPTVRGVELKFAEVAAGTTNLAHYASAYQCTLTYADGTVENLQQVNGASGSITIPTDGDAVRCVFRNSPLVAKVTINKQTTDALGQNPQPAEDWKVGASIAATAGTATQIPATTNQTTNSDGNAIWNVKFGASADRATVTVSENVESKQGYAFLSGKCVVTSLDGSEATTTLEGPGATKLKDIKPGDRVACTYVNKPAPGTLAIKKVFDKSVPPGSGTSNVFDGAYSCDLPAGSSNVVASGTWASTGTGAATLTPAEGTPAADQIPAGANCSVTEDQPTGSEGLPNSSWVWDTYSQDGPAQVTANGTGTITVTNKAKRVYGNFSVTKVVPEGSVVASGMTFGGNWTCTLGTGDDAETVTGTWGEIAPDETWTSTPANKIPLGATCAVVGENREDFPAAGYVWDGDPIIGAPVTAGASVSQVITVTNKTKAIVGPTLPLTGGQSAAMFTILGGGLLAGALALTAIRRRKGGAAHRA